MEPSVGEPAVVLTGRTARMRPDLVPLYALAAAVLCAAGGWYLLKELAPLLRPPDPWPCSWHTRSYLTHRRDAPVGPHEALRSVAGPARGGGGHRAGRGHLRQPRGPQVQAPRHSRARPRADRTDSARGAGSHLPDWLLDPIRDTARAEAETTALTPGPRLQPGKHRGQFLRRGDRRAHLSSLPDARSPSFSHSGPGPVSFGTG